MNQHIVIVGAGVIGCGLADELTRRGASVTVIDAAEAGSATSAATFAWVNSNDKTPVEYSNLNLLGIQAHERQARSVALNRAPWFHQTGNVQIAQTEHHMAAIRQKVQEHAANGIEARLLTPSQVRELEPSLQPPHLTGGAFFPQEGWIDVQRMCTSLLDRAIGAGASFVPHETVTNIQGNRVTTTTRDGRNRNYHAAVVILAAGNGNRKILAASGVDFPTIDPTDNRSQTPSVGIIGTTGPVRSGIGHIISGEGIVLRPARNGGITFTEHPTADTWDLDDPRIWAIPALLLDRARELYPSLENATTEAVRLGIRVLPKDGLTIADWITDDKSIYAVATHSGVTLAAHLAEVVAEEVLSGSRHQSLAKFNLARFAAL